VDGSDTPRGEEAYHAGDHEWTDVGRDLSSEAMKAKVTRASAKCGTRPPVLAGDPYLS
jgi:hypothetical protein